MKVRFLKSAQQDMLSIKAYVSIDSPASAKRLIKKFRNATERLKEFPESGRIIPEVQNSNLREVLTERKTLDAFGYRQGKKRGVYHTDHMGFRHVDLVLLNELSDTPYNAPYKIFASRSEEKQHAFERLERSKVFKLSQRLNAMTTFFSTRFPIPTKFSRR